MSADGAVCSGDVRVRYHHGVTICVCGYVFQSPEEHAAHKIPQWYKDMLDNGHRNPPVLTKEGTLK